MWSHSSNNTVKKGGVASGHTGNSNSNRRALSVNDEMGDESTDDDDDDDDDSEEDDSDDDDDDDYEIEEEDEEDEEEEQKEDNDNDNNNNSNNETTELKENDNGDEGEQKQQTSTTTTIRSMFVSPTRTQRCQPQHTLTQPLPSHSLLRKYNPNSTSSARYSQTFVVMRMANPTRFDLYLYPTNLISDRSPVLVLQVMIQHHTVSSSAHSCYCCYYYYYYYYYSWSISRLLNQMINPFAYCDQKRTPVMKYVLLAFYASVCVSCVLLSVFAAAVYWICGVAFVIFLWLIHRPFHH